MWVNPVSSPSASAFNAVTSAKAIAPSDQNAQESIAQFEALMRQPSSGSLMNAAESALLGYQSHLANIPKNESLGTDPLMTFSAMQSIMRASTTIEITAKIAGSLTQSINRLVSIQ